MVRSMKYASKEYLLQDIRKEHNALSVQLRNVPKTRWQESGVWGDGWTLADLVAHLAEWQRLFLTWYEEGAKGIIPEMPAPGYKWNEIPRLNRAIWEKHRLRRVETVRRDFEAGYRRILQLVEKLSSKQLLEAGHFGWTGRNPLATYLGPNTASHYRFAMKVLKRWLRSAPSDSSSRRPDKRLQPSKARPGARAGRSAKKRSRG
jgi:hypothetical protein